ncbi:stage II sporulation protein P [Desulfosporosinus meridiei]|uniref:Stage II sporulation protein P n=1 Tax=Desulfosporosinus meridiei (strain ATCC BAA-275 / DSM 13257 / KCTC 12902 / NCIMB 13706 / S10) TaxID=768704 RepID=J7J0H1_DESMD|nr:stage II sporulation protein P [Desulfosporosinus meridiei]AFQ45854.1 stage II sporulation protein P [Desulfosporosinus meridiei DSM 13257]
MLREDFYHRQKKNFKIWSFKEWVRGFFLGVVSLVIVLGLAYALRSGGAYQFVQFLTQQSFPFEAILLEGAPGYSQPERARVNLARQQGLAVSMFLLTGVNISDPRTFFLGFFSHPPQGPVWLGWAYNPDDPEFEGPILEPLESVTPNGNELPTPALPVKPGSSQVVVGIYNTHNSESYGGNGGPDRLPGKNGDIVTVGETLKNALEKKGVGTVHDTTIHDAVDFMKAYSESVKTAAKLLKDHPAIKVLLDIHRDGLPPGFKKSTVKVNGKEASKILVVIGKKNPHWQKNEALAKKLMAIAEKKHPGLFVSNISYAAEARYNQHLSEGGLLLEFGDQYNTLDESNRAAEAFAEVLAQWMEEEAS